MNRTKIEYLTHTWNPIAMRCSRVSEGCRRCWHLSMADRLAQNPTMSDDRRQAYGGGVPVLLVDELTAPLRTRKPAVIGVQFMGDLFHEDVPDEFTDEVYAVMAASQHHTFIVLTKRPEWASKWYSSVRSRRPIPGHGVCTGGAPFCMGEYCTDHDVYVGYCGSPWPLTNVVLGVSIEDQATADKRIPLLLQTPAACRVVSLEPMLGPVDLHNESGFERRYDYDWLTGENYRWDDGTPAPQQNGPNLNWVIMGCESGPGARPMQIEWARSIKARCVAAGIPLFYKQGPGDDGVVCGMPMLDGQVWAQKPEREQP